MIYQINGRLFQQKDLLFHYSLQYISILEKDCLLCGITFNQKILVIRQIN